MLDHYKHVHLVMSNIRCHKTSKWKPWRLSYGLWGRHQIFFFSAMLDASESVWTSTFSTVCPSWVLWLANAESDTMQTEYRETLRLEENMGGEGWTIFEIRLSVWQPELMNTPENTGLNDLKNKCNQQAKLHCAASEACLRL